jgi:hypothetical protein
VLLVSAVASLPSKAQSSFSNSVLTAAEPVPVKVKAGSSATVVTVLQLKNGYHMNSDKPVDEYLIPLRLTWTSTEVTAKVTRFPAAKMEKYEFSEKPLSVYSGDVKVETDFQVPSTAKGEITLSGKVRYQACTDKMCLQPKTIPVTAKLLVE